MTAWHSAAAAVADPDRGARLDSFGWGPAIEELAARFRLVLLDNRGSGRSDPLPQTVKIADMVRDVVSVLDDAGTAQTGVLGPASAASWRMNSRDPVHDSFHDQPAASGFQGNPR